MRICSVALSLLLGACMFVPATPAFAQQDIEIANFQWTDSVDRKTRQYNKKLSSPSKTKSAYLWMQLKGSPELLEKLRQTPDGKLPIRHEWYRYRVNRVSADMDVAINLSIGRKEDLQKLSYEVDSKGHFYWRVWSGKKNLAKGWWRVDVLDGDGQPLQCTDGEETKPCSFKIRIQ